MIQKLRVSLGLMFLFTLAASSASRAASGPEIKLLTGAIQPSGSLATSERELILGRAAQLRASGAESVHVLVQLDALPDAARREELRARGLDLGAYVPDQAWVAAVSTDRAASALADVSYARLWDSAQKVHPNVRAGRWASWSQDPTRPEWRMLFVQLHHDVDLVRLEDLALAHGAIPMKPVEGLHGATVWAQPAQIEALAAEEDVLWIEEGPPPLSPSNDGVRSLMNANAVKMAPYSLDGSGVRVFVYDGGTVLAGHNFFNPGSGSRVTLLDATALSNHSTHVAGTAAGDGDGGVREGMAPASTVLSAGFQPSGGTMLFWDNAGDIEADYTLARNTHNMDVANNSIGSNTAANNFPCEREGDYGVSSSLLDGMVADDNAAITGAVLLSWANGNERSGGGGRCGSHYLTTAPPSCAKNPIHVGALSSDGGSMTTFSSWGPCDDGRLKPLISAAGCEAGRVAGETGVISSGSASASATSNLCGTSMATPGVTGALALFIQDWRAQGHGGPNDRPLPALVKAFLMNTAEDRGLDGPDYQYGYGNVNLKGMVDAMRDGEPLGTTSALVQWGTDTIDTGQTDTFDITLPSGTWILKASLAWDDDAAAAFSATALVNDLTLEISDGATTTQAFILDPVNPGNVATRGVNTRDNQEQVLVFDAAAGTYSVRVIGTAVPMGPQSYGLVISAVPAPVIAGGCSNLIANSGFETDTTGWTLTGATRVAAPAVGHGAFSLLFGNLNNAVHEAFTEVSIPASATVADLTYYFHHTTDETTHSFDHLFAEVRSTAGTVLAALERTSDGWPAGQWILRENLNLLPWAGQTVRIAFRGTNDSSLPTRLSLDDVSATVCLPVATDIFADGFETGDTSAWSLTVP